jgi:arylsulfatase A-like enzyme
VVLFIDDYGWADFGGNGALPISETPNLDRLAGTGMRFTDFHSTPLCTPSRAQLLTGRYAGRHGVYKNFAPDSIGGLNTSEITLGEFMKGAGYATAMRESAGEYTGVGKWRVMSGWLVGWLDEWVWHNRRDAAQRRVDASLPAAYTGRSTQMRTRPIDPYADRRDATPR